MLIQQDNMLRDITSTYLLTISNGRFVLIDKSSALVVELFITNLHFQQRNKPMFTVMNFIITSKCMHGMNQTEAEYSRHGNRSQRAS